MVEHCSSGGVATEYCHHFAEVDSSVTFSEKALLKMTSSDINTINAYRGVGLKSMFFQDNYVYFIGSDGKDGVWRGFSGNANKNVQAPYVVCTVHTKESWERYQQEHQPEEETPPQPGTPSTPSTPNKKPLP